MLATDMLLVDLMDGLMEPAEGSNVFSPAVHHGMRGEIWEMPLGILPNEDAMRGAALVAMARMKHDLNQVTDPCVTKEIRDRTLELVEEELENGFLERIAERSREEMEAMKTKDYIKGLGYGGSEYEYNLNRACRELASCLRIAALERKAA